MDELGRLGACLIPVQSRAMQNSERMQEVVARLKREYPNAKTALVFRNAYEMLVATVLSAQSTDKKVNEITPELFERYPDVEALAAAVPVDVEAIVKPTGFFRQKTKHIIAASQRIVEEFAGRVPDTMEGLTSLPGVARKTANIVLANAYGKVEGIAVDTHVKRLSTLLGFTTEKDTDKIEQALLAITPRADWYALNYLLIEHGRSVCIARRPKCAECVLNDLCPSAFVVG